MPELPEVETLRAQLEPIAVGATVTSVAMFDPRLIKPQTHSPLGAQGATIEAVCRRGKWLWFHCDTGDLVIHLRMAGLLQAAGATRRAAALIELDDQVTLTHSDPRTFGQIGWWPHTIPTRPWDGLRDALCDPLSADDLSIDTRSSIKAVLCDQRRVVAGLGNICVDEVCARAGIHPARPTNQLDERERDALAGAIGEHLRLGIKTRGFTMKDKGWVDLWGEEGTTQHHALVKEREECQVCGHRVSVVKVANRTTHVCDTHQH